MSGKAVTMAGHEPVPRATKIQLSFEFDMQKQAEEQNRTFQCFLSEAYSPSTKPLSDLKPINLLELELEKHHRDRVVFVRTIEEPIRVASVQTLVQDAEGTADRLAIYNIDAQLRADDFLPEDAVLAIKEPFFTAVETGSATLRVDHPTDIVRLNLLDERVPAKLVEELKPAKKTALEWKAEGNSAYIKNDYCSALYGYGGGVKACSEEDELVRRDILRNRAIVNLLSQRYEQAIQDGEAAVIPPNLRDDADATALNIKAYDRAGMAAYDLGDFKRAKDLFSQIQKLSPSHKDLPPKLERIEARLKEQAGTYDFAAMSKSSSKRHNRLDHASFTSNTTIRSSGPRGRGLFAITPIPAGNLIICEKALSVAFASDPNPRSCTILDPKSKRAATGTQADLLYNLSQKLSNNAALAARFNALFDGKSHTPPSSELVDGSIPMDTFRVLGIIDHNAFGCPTVRSSSKSASAEASRQAGFHSTGLWVHIAYINHACEGNAMRSFIGDMMSIRATRDIAEGEEILHPYRIPDAVHAVTQQELKRTFGFECDCALCKAEELGGTPALQARKRAEAVERVRGLVRGSALGEKGVNSSKVARVEKAVAEVERTYAEEAFRELPRLGMVEPQMWLCQAYKMTGSKEKVVRTALALLRNLGFFVTVGGKAVAVERRHCSLDGTAIDAAMYAALAMKSQRKAKEAEQLEEFAKELYLIMNGELRGFNERYQES